MNRARRCGSALSGRHIRSSGRGTSHRADGDTKLGPAFARLRIVTRFRCPSWVRALSFFARNSPESEEFRLSRRPGRRRRGGRKVLRDPVRSFFGCLGDRIGFRSFRNPQTPRSMNAARQPAANPIRYYSEMKQLSNDTVNWVEIGDNAAGQRIDNFLLNLLKGVPKSHVYRILRSGEVRVNSKRVEAKVRLVVGDSLRVQQVRVEHSLDPCEC